MCIKTCLPRYELIKFKIENEVFMIVEVTEVIKKCKNLKRWNWKEMKNKVNLWKSVKRWRTIRIRQTFICLVGRPTFFYRLIPSFWYPALSPIYLSPGNYIVLNIHLICYMSSAQHNFSSPWKNIDTFWQHLFHQTKHYLTQGSQTQNYTRASLRRKMSPRAAD